MANPEARKHGFSVIEEPKPIAPDTTSHQAEIAELESESVTLFDASIEATRTEVELPEGEAVIVESEFVEEVVQVETPPTTPITPEFPKPEPKPKAIEVRDPDIRARVNQFLDQILEHPELLTASPGMVTRAFPRLKENVIDSAVRAKYVPVEQGRREDRDKFEPVGIASLLYLYEFGDNLPGRLKKQIQDIVTEEYKKRQTK